MCTGLCAGGAIKWLRPADTTAARRARSGQNVKRRARAHPTQGPASTASCNASASPPVTPRRSHAPARAAGARNWGARAAAGAARGQRSPRSTPRSTPRRPPPARTTALWERRNRETRAQRPGVVQRAGEASPPRLWVCVAGGRRPTPRSARAAPRRPCLACTHSHTLAQERAHPRQGTGGTATPETHTMGESSRAGPCGRGRVSGCQAARASVRALVGPGALAALPLHSWLQASSAAPADARSLL